MYFLFSGEGKADFGTSTFHDRVCEGDNYTPGPMAYIVDQIVNHEQGYSPIDSECVGFLAKQALGSIKPPPGKKGMIMPGHKRFRETGLYFRNAQSLARWAKEEGARRNDEVVAVLFRDCDNKVSSPRGEWQQKFNSVVNGFNAEGLLKGVPMLPKPKSEAWFICALKDNPYMNCDRLEDQTASEKSKRKLKKELRAVLDDNSSSESINRLVQDKHIDALQINMPSCNAFKERLFEVIETH